MLKIRVIPTLLWKDFGLVKGVGFDSWRRVGSILPAIKVYNTRDVDELIVMDIVASQNQQPPEHESVEDFSDACFVPLTVGGGITHISEITNLLHAGADKILINTAAYNDPNLIEKAAAHFGSQCVVVGIDVRLISPGKYACFSHAGTVLTDKNPVNWARELSDRGAGEIVISSIDRDGTMQGYDLALTAMIAKAVDIPVIASGGAGTYEHMRLAIQEGGVSAVAAASMFHFTEQTPAGAKLALQAAGIPVRKTYVTQ